MTTVGELIKELQAYPEDMMIVKYMDDHAEDYLVYSEVCNLEIIKVLPSNDRTDPRGRFWDINTMKHEKVKEREKEIIEVLEI